MIELIQHYVIPAAYTLLPDFMKSREATVLMLAIGLQESRFKHRAQISMRDGKPFKGPARGFWQFEAGGGCAAVLWDLRTRALARNVLDALQYPDIKAPSQLHALLEDNDIVAAACARLFIFHNAAQLPQVFDKEGAWDYYIKTWRPGRPHPETWDALHAEAVARVQMTL